jgi:hypothetical protein
MAAPIAKTMGAKIERRRSPDEVAANPRRSVRAIKVPTAAMRM